MASRGGTLRGGPAGPVAVLDEAAIDARVHRTGVTLALIADSFFWACWVFAFFYLRALNLNKSWMPSGVHHGNRLHGTITLVFVLLATLLYVGVTWLRPLTGAVWRWVATLALLCGLGAAWFQAWEMWNLGFGLTDGTYPAVFAGWIGAWLIHFFAAMFWLLTIVVQGRPAGDTLVRPYAAADFGRFLLYLAAIYVLAYILLYYVA
jgi:heme/copper-type cytochrome/quinol oxidase subunit 3